MGRGWSQSGRESFFIIYLRFTKVDVTAVNVRRDSTPNSASFIPTKVPASP